MRDHDNENGFLSDFMVCISSIELKFRLNIEAVILTAFL